MRRCLLLLTAIVICCSLSAQEIQVGQTRKAVRTSGDVLMLISPVASVATVLILKDWKGLKQGALAGVTTAGLSIALKYIVKKDRPDMSNDHSFPSFHTSAAFAGAAFLQRRYGWQYGIPAYVLAGYVGWSRVYGKKHDWWDVAAGAAIGLGSSYIFTRPFAQKHHLSISPIAAKGSCGIYLSMNI